AEPHRAHLQRHDAAVEPGRGRHRAGDDRADEPADGVSSGDARDVEGFRSYSYQLSDRYCMSHLSLVAAEPELLSVRSDLLGDLEVRSSDVFAFPKGMLGFPECRRFALLRGARDGLYWLQSLEYSALVFLLVDPFTVMSNYAVDVEPWQVADLGKADPSDLGVLAIVTLPSQRGDLATVNLQ